MLISTPLEINGHIFPNRAAMSPMVPNMAGEDGSVSEEYRNFYLARARSGAGYIVLGGAYVHENGKGFARQLGIYSDSLIAGLSGLARDVSRYARVGIQLSFKSLQKLPEHFGLSEIDRYREAFSEAAIRAGECGFDAVELHACHDYWLNYFLSPHFNHRSDKYGGTLRNRFNLLMEVVEGVRAAVKDMVLGVRLSMDEFLHDGLALSDTLKVGRWLQGLGVDYISASGGIGVTQHRMSPPMEVPRGSLLYLAQALKETVDIPVIGVGRLDRPEVFRKAVADGGCDIAAVGRALIADPEYVSKALEGRDTEIRPCLACNYCLLCLHRGDEIRCTVNPLVGRDLLRIEPLKRKIKVVVVGGGPAGLTAAAAASGRGAGVTLMEKENTLGGMLNAGKVPPHKEAIQELIDYLAARAQANGVEILTGRSATVPEIQSLAPDRVIIATGSTPIELGVEGLKENPRVLQLEELLRSGRVLKGGGYLVVGGGSGGLEAAEFIAQSGGGVILIEMTDELGKGLHATRLNLLLGSLRNLKVSVMTNTRLESVDHGIVKVSTGSDALSLGPFEYIVMAAGYRSKADLARELHSVSMTTIGDALQPRTIYEAVKEGLEAAISLDALEKP